MTENQRRLQNAPVGDDGIFVGPGWISERRVTEEELVRQSGPAEEELRYSHAWILFWSAVSCLGLAAALGWLLYEGLK